MNREVENRTIADWVENESYHGRYTFTRSDIDQAFPALPKTQVTQTLWLIGKRGVLYSPWQNFFVIIPTEYRLKGVVPPMFYIDQLMRFMGRQYYVGLLNAAAFYGASHQRVQTFYCIVDGGPIRSIYRKGIDIEFHRKAQIQVGFMRQFKTQMGTVNVSSPCLTALDLILFEQEIGGVTRAATVLAELVEEMRWSEQPVELLNSFNTPIVQRLGYILEHVLEEEQAAEELYALLKTSGRPFRKVVLKAAKAETEYVKNRWKIIDNQSIAIDEI